MTPEHFRCGRSIAQRTVWLGLLARVGATTDPDSPRILERSELTEIADRRLKLRSSRVR